MGQQLRFPTDSQDAIEQEWWPTVGQRFPFYARFWERFIGLKPGTTPFQPYGLRLPQGMSRDLKRTVEEAYLEISHAHYSEFCELAGAHFQASEAENSYALSPTTRVFRFLEAFNSFYDHLGTARNMACRTWEQAGLIARSIAPSTALGSWPGKNTPAFVESLLRRDGKVSQADDLVMFEDQGVPMRNHHIHDYGAFFVVIDGRFSYILPQKEASDYQKTSGVKVTEEESGARIARHLAALEAALDASEAVLATELNSCLALSGTVVDY